MAACGVVNRLPVGGLPEGVAWSANSQHVYVADFIDKTWRTFRVSGGKLAAVGGPVVLPGQPASMRGAAR